MGQNFEEWRDIAGYEGKYQVSSLGNVRAMNYHREGRCQVLKPAMDKYGYLKLLLCKNGKHKNHSVHRLVAEAFITNAEGLEQVNHKDECKTNNCVDNLEWCSCEYNHSYGTRTARQAAAQSKPVQQFSLDGTLVAVWVSTHEAERVTGIYHSAICSCCNGERHTAGGYKWQYA